MAQVPIAQPVPAIPLTVDTENEAESQFNVDWAKLQELIDHTALPNVHHNRLHDIDDALEHNVGGLGVGNFPVNVGGILQSSNLVDCKGSMLTAHSRLSAGNKTWIYGSIGYAGYPTGSLIYSSEPTGPFKLIHANRSDAPGNPGVLLGCYHAGKNPQMNPIVLGYYDSVGAIWEDLVIVEGNGNLSFNIGPNEEKSTFCTLKEETTILNALITDTVIQVPQYALLFAVSLRVTEAISGAATFFTVGINGNATLFSGVGRTIPVLLGSTDPCTAGGINYFNTATSIRFTFDALPDGVTGKVRVIAHYIDVTPPTS